MAFTVAIAGATLYFHATTANSGVLTAEKVRAEYLAEAQKYEWPNGTDWHNKKYSAVEPSDNRKISYAAGVGKGDAGADWFMAWAKVAVSANSTAAQKTDALKRLSRVTQTPYYHSFAREKDKTWFMAMVAKAQNGDLAVLRQFVDANG